jgi:plasmid replication initiation protein
MNILNLNQFWKEYSDGTEILLINGVQVASIQPLNDGIMNLRCEVYTYDSDFQGLFKSLERYEFKTKNEAKNKVGNILIGWIQQLTYALNSPCPNI